MLVIVGSVIAGLIASGIIVVGAGYVWKPERAVGFGIPGAPVADPAFRAWVRVKGGRDIGSGLCLAVVLALGSAHLLGWFLLAATVMAVCDGVIVLSAGGPKSVAYGVHESTAAVMLIGVVLLLLS